MAAQAPMPSTCHHLEAIWKTVGSSHLLRCRCCHGELERRFAGDEIPSSSVLFLVAGKYAPFDPKGWMIGWLR